MVDLALRRSALSGWERKLANSDIDGICTLREIPYLGMVNLRLNLSGRGTAKAVEEAIGFPLPKTPNTVTERLGSRALWLGPDEWLIVTPDGEQQATMGKLRVTLGSRHFALTDVSANRTTLQLTGSKSREILQKGCLLDLHPSKFEANQCAGTNLARSQVILEKLSDEPVWRIYPRWSFANYLADWLIDAMMEYRTQF
ncbi:MAG: sarcosine oxidase subunit gamma family protein [Rhodospirillales bacterium]